jgi:predicted outer membrane repeat protein
MLFSHPPRRPRLFWPHLEALEDSWVPTTVTNLLDSGAGSLRQAIMDTPAGGTVDFQPGLSGTITLTSTLGVTKDLTIAGPGQAVITVDGNHSGNVFSIALGSTVTISGLTIANGELAGFNELGGGIYNHGTLTLDAVAVRNNSVSSSTMVGVANGGGVYNAGTLTVTDSIFSGNVAGGGGSTGGGAIYNGGTLTVTDSLFADNQAVGPSTSGGAIENGLTMTVTGCTFQDNIARGAGGPAGGAVASYSSGTIVDSTFSGNSAGDGGAIAVVHVLTLSDCTISGNSASVGGGLYDSSGDIGGTSTLLNTLIAQNTASQSPDVSGHVQSQGHNLIGDGSGGSGFAHTDSVGTASSPIDPLLGPLQDNGGPTLTMALLPGSPALNAGDPAQLGVADQRGVARSGGVNIGAYQASVTAFVVTAPATITAGAPFDVTVTAVDPFGQTAAGYTGTVTFAASDSNPAVVLPADYAFTNADGGVHTFAGQATLVSAGSQTLTATDRSNTSLTGGAAVTVTPGLADHLLFLQQPTGTAAGQTVGPAVLVAVVDAFGNVETADNSDTITVSIGTNPSGGTLSGTLTVPVVNGEATFGDLSIDQPGVGYTLHVTIGGGLPDIDSNPFTITL